MDTNLAFTSIKFKARVINKQTLIHTMQYVCIAIHDRGELGMHARFTAQKFMVISLYKFRAAGISPISHNPNIFHI